MMLLSLAGMALAEALGAVALIVAFFSWGNSAHFPLLPF